MIRDIFWRMKPEILRRSDDSNKFFVKTVLHQNTRLKAARDYEALMITENADSVRRQHGIDLGYELYELKREKMLEEKQRIKLQRDEPEVRHLMLQLKRAHLQKDFNDQRIENQVKREKELQAYRAESLRFREQCLRQMDLKEKERVEQKRQQQSLRQALVKQIEMNGLKRARELEEKMKEREEMEKLIQTEKEASEREKIQLEKYRRECKEEVKRVFERKAQEKLKERLQDIANHKRFMEEIQKKDILNQKQQEEKRRYYLVKTALGERIGEYVYRIEQQKRERNDLLFSLHIQESTVKKDKELQKSREKEIERMLAMQQDMQRVYLEQEEEKAQKLEQQKAVQNKQIRKLAEHRRHEIEQKDERKRRNQQELSDYAQILELEKLKRENFRREKQLEHNNYIEWERKRSESIAKERQRLLQAEPKEILNCLQAGALRPEEYMP